MQSPQLIPPDINIEVLLNYYPEGQCKVAFNGLHKRNTYGDIIETEEYKDGIEKITVGRLSLYNSLPEFMFHPTDRFDNLPKYEEKERFDEELKKQEEEIENAFRFFAPIDILLLKLRSDVRKSMEPFAENDIVIEQVIGDTLTEQQLKNRFIKQAIHFLPNCKNIRGNRTLLTLMLRKVFIEEGLTIVPANLERTFTDEEPHYEDGVGQELGNGFLGNTYTDRVMTYSIHYWNDDEAGKNFLHFVDEVEELRLFIRDFFLSVEEDITFDISHDEPPLRLSDEVFYNYLNFNTNI